MKTITNKIIHSLINDFGFVVEKYGDNMGNSSKIALLKYLPDGIYSVIFSNITDESSNAVLLKNYLSTKNQNFSINNIIILKNEHTYAPHDPFYNYMLVNSKTRTIIYSNVIGNVLSVAVENSLQERRSRFFRDNPITSILITLNIIIFLYSSFLSRSLSSINKLTSDIDTLTLVTLGAKVNSKILNGEVFRLITCTFLHGNLIHLASNMLSLYMIGRVIEKVYGWKKYILIYLSSGILGSFASFVFSPYLSVGASGAIFGLFGAALIFGLKLKNYINREFITSLSSVIAVNIFLGLSSANIDNYGHIGGLLGGLIIGLLLFNKSDSLKRI